MLNTKKRGQFFSFDIIMGAAVFLIALFLLISYWWGIRNSFDDTRENMAVAALRVSDILMSPGNPIDWQTSATPTAQLGLMEGWSSSELDLQKADALRVNTMAGGPGFQFDYTKSKQILGIQNYEYYVTIQNVSDNSTIDCRTPTASGNTFPCIMGASPKNAVESVSVDRTAFLPSGEAVKIRTIIWINSSSFS